jgi:hypothetical protein
MGRKPLAQSQTETFRESEDSLVAKQADNVPRTIINRYAVAAILEM